MQTDIDTYNNKQSEPEKKICEKLESQIRKFLPDAQSKVWHGHPVWFIEGNPIVGYSKLKDRVQLLFWSGQSFDEVGLEVEGSFKAACKNYTSVEQIELEELERWLKKSIKIQWDYKNIVKKKGELDRLV